MEIKKITKRKKICVAIISCIIIATGVYFNTPNKRAQRVGDKYLRQLKNNKVPTVNYKYDMSDLKNVKIKDYKCKLITQMTETGQRELYYEIVVEDGIVGKRDSLYQIITMPDNYFNDRIVSVVRYTNHHNDEDDE